MLPLDIALPPPMSVSEMGRGNYTHAKEKRRRVAPPAL